MRLILTGVFLTVMLSACGQSSGSGSSGGSSTAGGDLVTGVYLKHSSADPSARSPVAGATIGVYARPISSGPVMADPPTPIAQAKTAADGSFSVHVPSRQRVFLAPIGGQPYTVGRWAQVGGAGVTLNGCSDCARPMSS
jgi:hypothetical protein